LIAAPPNTNVASTSTNNSFVCSTLYPPSSPSSFSTYRESASDLIMADETAASEADPQITFKVKTSSEGLHTITIAESATVLDLKNTLAGDDYEKIPAGRQRLIYSGRVMKDEDPLSKYKIKAGNTIHMVKSAASNAAQNPANAGASAAGGAPRAAPGVPTNMAAGTANNPLAGLTGARFAGHMGLPGAEMFGADGGVS
jgi:ubiquilin